MIYRLVIVINVLATLLCATSLTPAGQLPMNLSWPHMKLPKWSHGALIDVQYQDTNNPLIWIDDGYTQHTVPFSITGALSMFVYDCDRGLDGTLWTSGEAVDTDGRAAGFVAWIAADNSNSLVIRTGQYRPMRIAIAPDGTLWSVGSESVTRNPSPNAAVIRRFDKSGRTLSTLIQQSTILHLANLEGIFNSLRAASDRIAWYSVDFENPTIGRYVEVSLDGKLLTDISVSLPHNSSRYPITGFGLTDQGDAFVSTIDRVSPATVQVGIYILDRSANVWTPLLQRTRASSNPASPSDTFDKVLGANGQQLVIAGYKTATFYDVEK